MEYNNKLFLEMLKKEIGTRTIVEFAEKCGISRTNLGRILSGEQTSQPSKNTLRKISDHSSLDYDELLSVCGYAESPAQARKQKPLEERAALNARDIERGFAELTKGSKLYDSIKDFLDIYMMLYSYEDCKYFIDKTMEYEGEIHKGAENCAYIRFDFNSDYGTCNTYAIIYFAETKGGKIAVLDTAMDGKSLMEMRMFSDSILNYMKTTGEEMNERRYVYVVNQSAEERLLWSIFGNTDSMKKIPYTVIGFGFDMESVPVNFDKFLENHKDTEIEDKEIEEYLKTDIEQRNPEEHFKNYKDYITDNCGFQAVISNIIKSETDELFGFYVCDEEMEQTPKCIMLPNAEDSAGFSKIKNIVKKYVKELGINEYGTCVSFIYKYDNRKKYYI